MLTIRQKEKRETKQVRTSLKWHKLLKIKAARRSTTIAKVLDKILSNSFEGEQPGNVNDSKLIDHEKDRKTLNLSTKSTGETLRGVFE